MLTYLRPAFVFLILFTALTGFAYPLVITGIAQAVLPGAANGSLLVVDGTAIGSDLIGQRFSSDRYFQGRPSAAGPDGYDAMASSGSNLGPLSKKLMDRVETDILKLRQVADERQSIPGDAITTSASGLDPHITPAYADLQIERVARARAVSRAQIVDLVKRETEGALFGIIGEPRITVLRLNAALDAAFKAGSG